MPRSQRQSSRAPITAVPIETPAGVFIAGFSERGLAQLDFPGRVSPPGRVLSQTKVPAHLRKWTRLTREAVLAILAGEQNVSVPPLDVTGGTPFQRKVWAALQEIVPGKTKSYSEIAAAVGSPNATRAVGNACGANPIPLLIPCHRVLASGGKLGGFSGGMFWKTKLLTAEGMLPKARRAAAVERQRSFSFETAAA